MGNMEFWETLASQVETSIRALLPAPWSFGVRRGDQVDGETDGVAEFVGPQHQRITFALEVKRSRSESASSLADQLSMTAARASEPLLFVSDFVNPALRAALSDAGISFADSTGWVRITREKPLMVLSMSGADRSPKSREQSNVTRLNGKAASRIIRALLERAVPLGVRELAELTGTSPGSVSKLLPTLNMDGAIEREGGAVVRVRKRTLLDRWTQDYAFLNSNGVTLDYLAPRGLAPVIDALRELPDACVTGSGAARTYLPEATSSILPLTQLACFARDPQRLASDFGLIRTDRSTANVILTSPADPLLLVNPNRSKDGLPVVPVSQALADLFTLPGRAAQEAEQLIEALAMTDPTWME